MGTLPLAVIISGIALVLLISLFAVEERRGRRFVPGVRRFVDRVVNGGMRRLHRLLVGVGWRNVRITGHYLVHALLALFLRLVRFVEVRVLHLQKRNRRAVKGVQTKDAYLSAINEHKRTTALTPEEKRKVRSRHLGE